MLRGPAEEEAVTPTSGPRRFWKALLEHGVYTNAVLPPAVAQDDTLIRTSFMATHTHEQIDRALEVFETVGKMATLI